MGLWTMSPSFITTSRHFDWKWLTVSPAHKCYTFWTMILICITLTKWPIMTLGLRRCVIRKAQELTFQSSPLSLPGRTARAQQKQTFKMACGGFVCSKYTLCALNILYMVSIKCRNNKFFWKEVFFAYEVRFCFEF